MRRPCDNDDQLEHDERYNHADEHLEVIYKLPESSWEDDAVVRDRARGIFADPDKVREIGHDGKYFKVPGIHISEPSPQRTPVIYQVGASTRGIEFAAGNAEVIFVGSSTKALLSGWMGIDSSQYDLDEPIGNVESNANQSAVANFQKVRNDDGGAWTVRDLAEFAGIGGMGPRVVGPGAEVAEELIRSVEETDVDGFNLAYPITPGSFEDVVTYVVPELQQCGAYPTEYAPGALRNKLFGKGNRLPEEHRRANYRIGAGVIA